MSDEIKQIRIPAHYKPRPEQLEFWKAYHNGVRFFDLCWHRREGKDLTALNATVEEILTKRPGLAWHMFPTLAQGRKVLWDATDNEGRPLTSAFPKELVTEVNKADMRIKCKFVPDLVAGKEEVRESTWQVVGADNPDSLRGGNPILVVISEFGDIPPNVWYEIIQPILLANNGKAMFVWTPKGKNHAYVLHQAAMKSMNNPDEDPHFKWFAQVLTADDTTKWVDAQGVEVGIPTAKMIATGQYKRVPVITKEAINEARKQGMDESKILQEFYCNPPETLVTTGFGQVRIDSIVEGGMVLTHSGRMRKVLDTMVRPYDGELIELHTYGNGTPLKCTPNHPVRVYNPANQTYSWVKAEDLKVGMMAINTTTPAKIWKIDRVPYNGNVYNLSVEHDESFIANGIVVHNCSFEAALKGAYFGEQMNDAVNDGRISSNIVHRPDLPVMTAWDLGMGDTMVIVFAQCVDERINIIDCISASGKTLDYYIREVQKRPYNYSFHFGPHDLAVRDLTAGSRLEYARKLGIAFKVNPRVSHKEDSINAARAILPRCAFNIDKCPQLIEALKAYTKKWNDKLQSYSDTPLHDWASDYADAFQCLAMGLLNYPKALRKLEFNRDMEDELMLTRRKFEKIDDNYDIYNYRGDV